MSIVHLFVWLVLLSSSKRDGAPAAASTTSPAPSGPFSFPADNTAASTPAPAQSAPGPTVRASIPAPGAGTTPGGVAPGSPEPGWKAYSPLTPPIVSRAFEVLRSGAKRVKEADPTGRFSKVLYRRESNRTTGKVSVTAWRPATETANA
jgi:hypothetical protein